MEPIFINDYLALSTQKNHIYLMTLIDNSWKIFKSFDSFHIGKISSLISLSNNFNSPQTIISFSYDKQIKIWTLNDSIKEFTLSHQRFF